MKTKWLFIKMIWKVMTNQEQGWIWLKMEEREQKSFIENDKTVVNIRYLVVDKIVHRIETPINRVK